MTGGFGDQIPGGEQPRKPSPGEIEIEQGSNFLMLVRWLKVPMPREDDPASFERVGVLLTRRFPWIAKVVTAFAQGFGLKKKD